MVWVIGVKCYLQLIGLKLRGGGEMGGFYGNSVLSKRERKLI